MVIIPEHKGPLPETVERGITPFTVHVRRAAPDTLDPKLNSHSKLNDIQACIQAYSAGADEALMLDPQGFVATCNSAHFFIVGKSPDGNPPGCSRPTATSWRGTWPDVARRDDPRSAPVRAGRYGWPCGQDRATSPPR